MWNIKNKIVYVPPLNVWIVHFYHVIYQHSLLKCIFWGVLPQLKGEKRVLMILMLPLWLVLPLYLRSCCMLLFDYYFVGFPTSDGVLILGGGIISSSSHTTTKESLCGAHPPFLPSGPFLSWPTSQFLTLNFWEAVKRYSFLFVIYNAIGKLFF